MTDIHAVRTHGFALDADFLAALMERLVEIGPVDVPVPQTIDFMREMATLTFPIYGRLIPARDDVSWRQLAVERPDGTRLRVRWYTPADRDTTTPSAAVLYVHGGGMVSGDLEGYHPIIARYVGESGTAMLALEYRLAPEHPAPAALEDCLTALQWLHESADVLAVDPTRIGIMGDSGGGGIAASTALAARDRRLPGLARQVLVYPMLDDRTRHVDEALEALTTWTYESNALAWDAVLCDQVADDTGHVAPARAADLSGLPPTYLDTGELDIFRDEILVFAQRLLAAGVSTELHVHPGVPHAFEIAAPDLPISQRILADRYRALSSI